MIVGIFFTSNRIITGPVLQAFANGVRNVGDKCLICSLPNYKRCDVAVVWGYPKASNRGQMVADILRIHLQRKSPFIVIDGGYVKRFNNLPADVGYFSVGWNGLNGRAGFCNKNSPADRWEKLDIPIQPKSNFGEEILVCGQVFSDASVYRIDFADWCNKTISTLRKNTDRKIIFRPHPMNKHKFVPQGAELTHGTLQENLDNAWAVVTYNSNTGVDATIAGKHTFACDAGSMVWSVCNKDVTNIESPKIFDRTQWAYDIAYAQWKIDEMESGEAWKHLRRCYRR